MKYVTPDLRLFVKLFSNTHHVKNVVKQAKLISLCNEFGGTRFYLFPPQQAHEKLSISIFQETDSTTWELSKVISGRVDAASIRKGLTANQVIHRIWAYINTGEWSDSEGYSR